MQPVVETGVKKPTIKDVAKASGYSLSTVSLALNNDTRISEATRAKVRAAADQLDYHVNVNARGLVSKYTHIISVCVPALSHVFSDIYFGEIISGIYDEASSKNYKILLDIAKEPFIKQREYISILRTRRADGMLFIASSIEDQYLRDFESTNHPFLLVNHYFPESPIDHVMVDYVDAAQQAADHLCGLGHHDIGLIVGDNTFTGIDFRLAFEAACSEHNGSERRVAVQSSTWDEHGGFEAARTILQAHPNTTAIMAANDRMAMGAMHYLQSNGIAVPGKVSVMGMDNIPAGEYTTPALTTLHPDLYQLGRDACAALLRRIQGEANTIKETRPVSLVPRSSTGPARV